MTEHLENRQPMRDVNPSRFQTSVIVPFAGNIESLQRQLNALRQQANCDPFNVVVSCNKTGGSPARVHQAVADRWEPDRLLVLDSSEKTGPSYARNRGWRFTNARMILFCDDDDLVHPGWVGAMQAALQLFDMVGGRLEYESLNAPSDAAWNAQARDGLPRKFRHLTYAPSCNLGMRREALVSVGGFDEAATHAEDIDLCWRAQYSGASIGFAPDAVIAYKLRDTWRTTWTQARSYGLSDGWLLRRHRSEGARRPAVDSLRALISAGRVMMGGLLGLQPSRKVASRVGNLVGRVIGTVRFRVWVI